MKLLTTVAILIISLSAWADEKTVTKVFQTTNGVYLIEFRYEDSVFVRPATNPWGCPHYDATVIVFKVGGNKIIKVGNEFRGTFTDGKCYEDSNLDTFVKKAEALREIK